jgi:hypothetical protein
MSDDKGQLERLRAPAGDAMEIAQRLIQSYLRNVGAAIDDWSQYEANLAENIAAALTAAEESGRQRDVKFYLAVGSDLADAQQAGLRDGIEMAARVCDEIAQRDKQESASDSAYRCRDAIRALLPAAVSGERSDNDDI